MDSDAGIDDKDGPNETMNLSQLRSSIPVTDKNESKKTFLKTNEPEDDDLIGPPIPLQFVSKSVCPNNFTASSNAAELNENESSDDNRIGPPIPSQFQSKSISGLSSFTASSSNATGLNENESNDDDLIGPPIPPQFQSKPVSSPSNFVASSNATDLNKNELDNENLIGPPIPSQFKRHSQKTPESTEIENQLDDGIGPEVPLAFRQDIKDELIGPSGSEQSAYSNTKISHAASSDESEDESEEPIRLPTTNNIDFHHGSKAVTALAIDPTGTRFVSGSLDYEVRFWDFIGMNSSLQSFRSLYPCGNYPIKALTYSSTGDAVLVVSGMAQAKVLDRDGHEKLECVKGDQYISDMARTKGHTSPLTDGCWHPRVREQFLTSSEDSTLRLWNVSCASKHQNIIKCKSKNGLKTTPTACAFNRDGTLIACVCQDGSFQLWDTRKMFVSPSKVIREAHQNGTDTSCVAFSYSNNVMCTRGGDDTLKLWDVRMFKKAVRTADNLFSRYSSTDCMFGPRDDVIITGVSLNKGEETGKLLFFDANTLHKVQELDVTTSHVIKTQWHPRLQQIFVGCGNGLIKVFYGEESSKGAKLCAAKRPNKSKHVEVAVAQQIITPHALPLFRQDRPKSIRKQQEKERLDPVKSRRPDLPIKSGQGGRVAATGSTLSSYVIRNLGLSKRVEDDQDPREAILKYAKEAAENPYWISPAYAKTQPKTIFSVEEGGGDAEPAEKKKKT